MSIRWWARRFELDRDVLPYPRGAPAMGADTVEVLGELGYCADDVARLSRAGV